MEELLPGIHHWTAFYDSIGERVHSYYVEGARALLDPILPDEGMDAFADLPAPQQVLLTNRLHFRHSDRFRDAFGATVRASEPGMHHLAPRGVEPFRFGDEVAPGITAVEVDVLCPDETALHVAFDGGYAIAIADSILHRAGAPLGFVSDPLLGDDPGAIKRGLRERFRSLLERDFDALLFAHGEPIARHGKSALRDFVRQLDELGD
jgi:hypothetical protein